MFQIAKDIKRILFREKKLAELSCKSGGFTEEFAYQKFGVNDRRLKDLCEHGFFERKEFNIEDSDGNLKKKYAYDLGDKAKEYVKQSNICEITQGINGYRHTTTTQEVVYNLIHNEGYDIKDILNEKEQEQHFKEQIEEAKGKGLDFRVNDLAIVTETEIRVIEIDTDYPKTLVTQHKNYAEKVVGVKYESIKG